MRTSTNLKTPRTITPNTYVPPFATVGAIVLSTYAFAHKPLQLSKTGRGQVLLAPYKNYNVARRLDVELYVVPVTS